MYVCMYITYIENSSHRGVIGAGAGRVRVGGFVARRGGAEEARARRRRLVKGPVLEALLRAIRARVPAHVPVRRIARAGRRGAERRGGPRLTGERAGGFRVGAGWELRLRGRQFSAPNPWPPSWCCGCRTCRAQASWRAGPA